MSGGDPPAGYDSPEVRLRAVRPGRLRQDAASSASRRKRDPSETLARHRRRRTVRRGRVRRPGLSLQHDPTDDDPGDAHDGGQDPSQVEDIVKQCLSRLYVVRCSSSSQFLITLHSLETLLGNNPDISLLVIDSVSEFYWINRTMSGGSGHGPTNSNKLVVEALRKLLITYNLVAFCAKAELFEQRTHADNPDRGHQDFMGHHWSRLVTHRWTLAKTRPTVVGVSGQVQNCYCITVNGGTDAQKQLSFLISNKGVKFVT